MIRNTSSHLSTHFLVISMTCWFPLPIFYSFLNVSAEMSSRLRLSSDCVWSVDFGSWHPVLSFDLTLLFLVLSVMALSQCVLWIASFFLNLVSSIALFHHIDGMSLFLIFSVELLLCGTDCAFQCFNLACAPGWAFQAFSGLLRCAT